MCNYSDQYRLKFDLLMHEYDKLREAILNHDANIHRTNQILAGLIAASIGGLIAKLDLITAIAPFLIILAVTFSLRSSFILFINSRHLRNLEENLNQELDSNILTWESSTCRKIFSEKLALHNPLFLSNLIIFGVMLLAFLLCLYTGYQYIKSHFSVVVAISYLVTLVVFLVILLLYGSIWSIYLKPGGKIERIIKGD